jgi:cobalt/nickel transport system ATP-binding protein
MSDSLFEVRGVSYSYDALPALSGIDLSVRRGSRIALLGANGSGKSTFLRLLDGLDFPQEGTIAFDGQALTPQRLDEAAFAHEFRRRVGLVFQNPDVQLFNATVFDELAFGPLQLRWPHDEIRSRIDAVMQSLDIAHLANRPPHRLSMGEKKRVAIASVLVIDPEVLLLDEPTAALDPRSQSEIINLLAGWSAGAKTAITATHDLGIVEDIADHCVIFESGRVAAEGPPREIVQNEELLLRTGLLHAHRHRHESGVVHSHPHLHRHGDHHH